MFVVFFFFFRGIRGPISRKCIKVHIQGQMLIQSFANGWRQVDFGLIVPDTVPFTNESIITALSKYHSQLELTHSSKIYVAANVAHLIFCLFNFPSTY